MPDDPSSKDPKDNNVMYSAMANDQTPERSAGSAAETNLEKMIGDRLKQYYATRLSQPLPDKFADLLRDLANKEAE
jgi:Anti-sigma factor NepR